MDHEKEYRQYYVTAAFPNTASIVPKPLSSSGTILNLIHLYFSTLSQQS